MQNIAEMPPPRSFQIGITSSKRAVMHHLSLLTALHTIQSLTINSNIQQIRTLQLLICTCPRISHLLIFTKQLHIFRCGGLIQSLGYLSLYLEKCRLRRSWDEEGLVVAFYADVAARKKENMSA